MTERKTGAADFSKSSAAPSPEPAAPSPKPCSLCGAPRIESWPFIHCYKCGKREDRPDIGLYVEGSFPLRVRVDAEGGD